MVDGELLVKKLFLVKRLGTLAIIATMMLATGKVYSDFETQTEQKFRNIVGALLDSRTHVAFDAAQQLLEQRPNFSVNKMIYADLLAAYSHQQPLFGLTEAHQTRRVTGIREEMISRLTYRAPPPGYLPAEIIQLSPRHRFILILNAATSRLYLFKNSADTLKLIGDYYISIGKDGIGKVQEGDDKTPLGLYHITSYLPDKELIELYGPGAFTLNYPNDWDRLFKRDGFGIWLHGMPRSLNSRPPRDSRGCIILNNQLFEKLTAYIEPGKTPLLLTTTTKWLPPEEWKAQKQALLDTMNRWRQDWEDLKVEKYLSYYSTDYRTVSQNYEQMVKQTQRNAKQKTFVKVEIKDLDIFSYPGESGLLTTIFDQNYQSNNYNIKYRKQQFWQHETEGWKIIYEGQAKAG